MKNNRRTIESQNIADESGFEEHKYQQNEKSDTGVEPTANH